MLLLLTALLLASCSNQLVPNTTTSAQQQSATTQSQPVYQEVVAGDALIANREARLAIAKAIDKTFISDIILNNSAKSIDYLVTMQRDLAYSNGYHYDLAAAKEHWQNARDQLNMASATLTLLTYDSDGAKKIADYLKLSLETNLEGLTVEVLALAFGEKAQAVAMGNYQLNFSGWSAEYPDALSILTLWSAADDAVFNYANSEYQTLLDALATSEQQRIENTAQAERLLIEEDIAVIPLYQLGRASLINPNLEGLVTNRYGAKYNFQYATVSGRTSDDNYIRLALSANIDALDSGRVSAIQTLNIIGAVFEGLVGTDPSGALVAKGAERWTVSEDGKQYVFYLRQNARWSNGQTVTADDYLFAFERLADADNITDNQKLLRVSGIVGANQVLAGQQPISALGVVALDDYTLQINLEKRTPYFMELISHSSFYPINRTFYDAQNRQYATNVSRTLYNGPYSVSNWDRTFGFSLVKNSNYWDSEHVNNAGVILQPIKNQQQAIDAFKAGELDIVTLEAAAITEEKSNPALVIDYLDVVYFLNFKK